MTQIKYEDAIVELEAMVAKFERAEVGIDELVSEVQRAGVLIKTCRARLRTVEEEVTGAIAALDASNTENADPAQAVPVPPAPVASVQQSRPTAKPAPARAVKTPIVVEASIEDDPFADLTPSPFDKDTSPGGLFGL